MKSSASGLSVGFFKVTTTNVPRLLGNSTAKQGFSCSASDGLRPTGYVVRLAYGGDHRTHLTAGRRSNHHEVRVGEVEAGRQLGKLGHAAADAGAVGIERQRTGRIVVDDAVLGVGRRGADVEGVRIQRSRRQPREHRVVQPEGVPRHHKVVDGVDIGRGAERRVEQKEVLAGVAGQRVVAQSAVEGVAPETAAERIAAGAALEIVVTVEAVQVVGAVPADDRIRLGIADQFVDVGGADQVFDRAVGVTVGLAFVPARCVKVGVDSPRNASPFP